MTCFVQNPANDTLALARLRLSFLDRCFNFRGILVSLCSSASWFVVQSRLCFSDAKDTSLSKSDSNQSSSPLNITTSSGLLRHHLVHGRHQIVIFHKFSPSTRFVIPCNDPTRQTDLVPLSNWALSCSSWLTYCCMLAHVHKLSRHTSRTRVRGDTRGCPETDRRRHQATMVGVVQRWERRQQRHLAQRDNRTR